MAPAFEEVPRGVSGELVAPEPPGQVAAWDEVPQVVVGFVATWLGAQQGEAFRVDGVVQPCDVCERDCALVLLCGVGGAEGLGDAGEDGLGVGVVQGEPDDGDADVAFTSFEGCVDGGRVMDADQAGPVLPVEGCGLGFRALVCHDRTIDRAASFEPLGKRDP